jgi:glutamyl-tRNA(Gln) amidotransferase subunit E
MICGIEIHQRLSGRKLFCGCPAAVDANGEPQRKASQQQPFARKLHAVRSELGELDSAVRLEAVRERNFEYVPDYSCACLVESDEEPPHPISIEAVHAALVVCGLLSANVVDEMHIMRKTVIDGSNTSGFQRTALIGIGGIAKTPSGSVPILSVCLEEESAGIIEGSEERAKYSLDRLGIPLVEIATAPTLKSGQEAQDAALAIGTLLRRTGLVQRGIGTIRQDLNISIPEGARVEIKGVQDLSLIAKTVDLEAERQKKLSGLLREAKSRLKGAPIEEKFIDLTSIFSGTSAQMIAKGIKSGSRIMGVRLPEFAGLLGAEVNPGRRLGSELADYARSTGVKGIIHSDEQMEKYGIGEDEFNEVRMALGASEKDAFALVIADEKKALAALSEVVRRASFFGVMEETRRANPDGTSSYMRPLPGRARMYPETDVPFLRISHVMREAAKYSLSTLSAAESEKEGALQSINDELKSQLSSAKGLLSPSGTEKMGTTPEISAFIDATGKGVDPKLAASAITNALSSLKREGVETQKLSQPRFVSALVACKDGLFAKAALQDVLRAMCKDEDATPTFIAKELSLSKITGKDLLLLISREKLDMQGLMAKYRLRVDASEAQQILSKKK